MTGFKDIQTAAQSDLFQHIVTLIAPGAIASSPTIVWLFVEYPHLFLLARENSVATSLIVLLVVIIVGLLLFECGGYYEIYKLDDELDRETGGDHLKKWYSYLTLELSPDHIGRRYVGRLVVFLKFELASLVGLPISLVTFAYLFRNSSIPTGTYWCITIVLLCLIPLMGKSAQITHQALSVIREKILALRVAQGGSGASA